MAKPDTTSDQGSNQSTLLTLIGIAILGIAAGWFCQQTFAPSPTADSAAESSHKQSIASQREYSSSARRTTPVTLRSLPPSNDTLEDLLALPNDKLYGRLAHWMMDASSEDIGNYWAGYNLKEEQNSRITDLVMINWTRIDPQTAISATAGTSEAHFAWWAWSCHDPDLALSTAIESSPDHIGNVAWGLGEFHPKWLRENFEKIPESSRSRALSGLIKWGEVDDALATLDFLKQQNWGPPEGMLKNLIRQDPWAAYDWFQKNEASASNRSNDRPSMNLFIETLAKSHPEILDQVIAREPSGANKLNMENAAFTQLLKTDPDLALQQAEATKAPAIASERISAVALKLARTDPDRAFDLVERLFETNPSALVSESRVSYPNGGSSSSGDAKEASALIHALLSADPARLMDGQLSSYDASKPDTPPTSTGFRKIAEKWASRDVTSLAEWVVAKEDPTVTLSTAPYIIEELREESRFEEAIDWAFSIKDTNQYPLTNTINNWHRLDPDAALQWLESSGLPPEEITKHRETAERRNSNR